MKLTHLSEGADNLRHLFPHGTRWRFTNKPHITVEVLDATDSADADFPVGFDSERSKVVICVFRIGVGEKSGIDTPGTYYVCGAFPLESGIGGRDVVVSDKIFVPGDSKLWFDCIENAQRRLRKLESVAATHGFSRAVTDFDIDHDLTPMM